ncbi:unnamed protein product [Clonostachys byssicola]|uniref:Stress-response A/B barrel domain-containing protein n=1 Tax=Clonostachys byssicola TaxID=160290 RepID=A0A9N9U3Y6_9HYPO|nr:unnamed protein product [Clonostachys byssicola]
MLKFRVQPVVALLLIVITALFMTITLVPNSLPRADNVPLAVLTHTVLFKFSAKANAENVKAACARFLKLKDDCILPGKKRPYIVSMRGGQDNSPEGLQDGFTHGFVVQFHSAKDRDYYVNSDPAHQAFKESISSLVDKALVVDFDNGVY